MSLPPYASSLHFELYKDEKEHYVQLFYRKNGVKDISLIEIPNCGTKCPLQTFKEIYQKILPTKHISDACKNDEKK